jgi:tetratricopeptide (TPR) repeat protein
MDGGSLSEVKVPDDCTISEIVTWNSSVASSIPVYYKNWTTSNLPSGLNLATTKDQINEAMSIWNTSSGQTFGFTETNQITSVNISWSNNTFSFPHPATDGGITAHAVEYNGSDAKAEFVAYTQFPLNQGISYSEILFNRSATLIFSWTNDVQNVYFNSICFKEVALHELGHLIGLAHCTISGTVMYPEQMTGTDFYSLTQDDLTGLGQLNLVTDVCETCPPEIPDNFTATIVGQDVVLTWDPYDYYVIGFKIYKNGEYITLPNNQTSYTYTNGVNSLPAEFKLGGYNIHGESITSPINISISPSSINSTTYWTGVIFVNSNVTVSSTANLIIGANTKVIFNSGNNFNLTVNGLLGANGTGLGHVLFTSNSANPSFGNWGSLIFNGISSSYSYIDYTDIKYGAEIQCLNNANVTISNSLIDHCTQGIYLNGAAPQIIADRIMNPFGNGVYGSANGLSPLIKNCVIKKTDNNKFNYEGIYLTNYTNPYMTGNDIQGFDYGIYYGGGGSGNCTEVGGITTPTRNNRLKGNHIGLCVSYGGYLVAGMPAGTPPIGSNNSISGNSSYDARAYQNGNIWACYNWWGTDGRQFDIYSGGQINTYDLLLTNDPWYGYSAPVVNTENMKEENASLTKSTSNQGSPDLADIIKGLTLEKDGKIDEAISHYKEMIDKDSYSNYALSSLARIKNSYSKEDLFNYFSDLSVNTNKTETNPAVLKLLAGMYLQKDRYDDAVKNYDKVIKEYGNSYEGIGAKFDKFFAALHNKKDKTAAAKLLSVIETLKITDDELLMRKEVAEFQLYGTLNDESKSNDQSISLNKSVNNSQIPKEYGLLGNYPNPFNPTTTISYNLPRMSDVELKIYDILGHEVKSFFISSQSAGTQNIVWNGTNNVNEQVSSGIYLYRFRAISREGKNEVFEKSAKLIMLK